MTPIELQRKGFKALVDALGIVDAIRFIHQYDSGSGDYTCIASSMVRSVNNG